MLYADLELPADVRDALVDEIDRKPIETFKKLLVNEPEFAPGFRPDPKNLASFRKRLRDKLTSTHTALTSDELWALRDCGTSADLICVFSARALTDGFDALAGFLGGAKLVAGMLVDVRNTVVAYARKVIAEGRPLPPPPTDCDTARANLEKVFRPFIRAMSKILVAPVAKQVVKEEKPAAPVPNEAIKRDVAKLMKKFARLERDVENANHRIVELVRENVRLEAQLAEIKKERNSALETAKDAKRDLKAAKRAIRRAKPGVEAAEEAQTEAEERAREAKKRAREAEEALEEALARAERAEAALAARADAVAEPEEPEPAEVETEELEAPIPEPVPEPVAPSAPTKPLDAAHAAFEAMLAESVPPLKPAFQNRPEKLLSRVFHAHYNRTDPVIFLVDGHNILNLGWTELSKERTNGLTHREVRELFVEKCKVLALGFPNSRTVVFFDGEDARQVPITPNLVVEYSGNPEHIHEHRADRVIVGYANYLHTQEKIDPWSLIVVSADQGLCADARIAGAMTIHHHNLFLDLLAACR